MEYDVRNNTAIWRECMRVRIRQDVRKPLKRKKKIVKKDGKEFTVMCKYERLGEFCSLCGFVSHTERFCRRFIDKRGSEGEKEWGLWLKAPPRRAANQNQSRWLRDEGDATWESKIGGETNYQNFRGDNHSNEGRHVIKESNSRKVVTPESRTNITKKKLAGFKINSNVLYGLGEEENIGLRFDERKRSREDPAASGLGDVIMSPLLIGPQVNEHTSDASISTSDLSASSTSVLAELALQASRFQ